MVPRVEYHLADFTNLAFKWTGQDLTLYLPERKPFCLYQRSSSHLNFAVSRLETQHPVSHFVDKTWKCNWVACNLNAWSCNCLCFLHLPFESDLCKLCVHLGSTSNCQTVLLRSLPRSTSAGMHTFLHTCFMYLADYLQPSTRCLCGRNSLFWCLWCIQVSFWRGQFYTFLACHSFWGWN